jgi:hypothetical protein
MNTYPDFESTSFDTNDFVADLEQYEDVDTVVLALGLDGLVDEEKEVVEQPEEPTKVVITNVIEPQKEWKGQKEPSKMDLCRVIFAANHGKVARKVIIGLFMVEAGCTSAGASTYYQTLTKQATQ